jgi:hypothetical protein
MESDFLAMGSAEARPSRFTQLACWVAVLSAVLFLFYGLLGYWGCADMFGERPRWRGMNRGPDGLWTTRRNRFLFFPRRHSLKAWWLPANGKSRGAVIIAHGIDHTRQVMLPRAAFLVRGGYDVLAITS